MIGLQYSEGVWYMYFLALDETKDGQERNSSECLFSVNGQYVLFCSIEFCKCFMWMTFQKFYEVLHVLCKI